MSDPFDVSLRVRLNYEAGGAAKTALSDVEAIRASAAKLGQSVGTFSGDGIHALSAGAVAARRAMAETAEAAGRLATVAGPAAATAEIGRMRAEAGTAGRAVDALGDKLGAALKAQRAAGGFKNGAELEAFLKTFDAQVTSADRAVGRLSAAAGKLAASVGPGRLAEGMAGISPAAVEARRHIDDVGTAARTAQRSLERMGVAALAAGGGGAGGNGGTGHSGHGAGGDGLRNALVAGARPLHMERLLASAMTPVGLAGLGAGLALSEVGRAMTAAQKQSIDFEAEMVAVKRAVGDIPTDGLKALQSHLLDVSAATGATKEQVAAMAAAAARAGTPVGELGRVVERTAKVANVLGLSTEDAGEKLTRYGKAWHADQARSEDTTDAIALLAQRNGANGGALLDLVNSNSELRANNVSARQIAAFGATGQRAGLSPQEMSGLLGGLTEKLRAPERAGQEFKDELGLDLKINPSDARLRMRDDPTTLITQILDSLKGKSEAARQRAAERLLGPEEGERLAKLADHVDVLRQNFELAENAAERSGAVQKLFNSFDETTRAKIDKVGASFDVLAVKLGTKLLPAVGASADAIAHLFDQLAQDPKGAMGLADSASDIVSKWTGGDKRSPAYGEMLKQRAHIRGAKTDAEVEAWIRTNRPGDYDAIYRPERRTKDDADVPAGADPVLRDVRPDASRPRNVEELRRTEDFLARQLSEAKPEHATNIRRQLDEVRRQLDGAKTNPAAGGPAARLPRDQHGSMLDPSMIHRASYGAGDDDRSPIGRSPSDEMRAVMAAATKEGVVAGLREVLDMRGGTVPAAGGLVNASWETGGLGDGSGGGAGRGRAAPSIRYGRQYAGAAGNSGAYDVGGRASAMAGDVAQRASQAMAKLQGLGWSREAAAAAVGNAQQESGVRSDGPLGDTARFGTGDDAAHGMFQWRGQRFRDLKRFAGEKGKGWKDFDTQVEFFDQESRKYGSADWRKTQDVVAANRGMKRFEGYGDDSFGGRLANARQILAGKTGGDFYAAQGGAGAARAGIAGGTAARAADLAGKLDGMTSGQAGAALGSRMTPGEWCADFVNGALKAAGGKGSGSSMAMSFQKWGHHVGLGDVKRGDVIVENHGGGHGHVGLATGAVKRDAAGNVVAVGMTSGNHGNKVVKDYWERVGQITDLRRAEEETAKLADSRVSALSSREAARALARQGKMDRTETVSPRFTDRKSLSVRATPAEVGGPGASAGTRQVAAGPAPIQNFYGNHDPAQTARMAMLEQNREVRRAQARALHSVGRTA